MSLWTRVVGVDDVEEDIIRWHFKKSKMHYLKSARSKGHQRVFAGKVAKYTKRMNGTILARKKSLYANKIIKYTKKLEAHDLLVSHHVGMMQYHIVCIGHPAGFKVVISE